MKRHPRRSDEEWLNIIKECRTSGLCDKAWCQDHGIQPSKFYYHIRRLRAKACEITERDNDPHNTQQIQEIVPISFPEQPTEHTKTVPFQMESAVRICYNGIQLDISNRAERETIANTLSVLRSLC